MSSIVCTFKSFFLPAIIFMLNLMMFLFQDHSYIPQCVGLLKLAAPRNGKSTMALDQICPFLGMFYLHYVAY